MRSMSASTRRRTRRRSRTEQTLSARHILPQVERESAKIRNVQPSMPSTRSRRTADRVRTLSSRLESFQDPAERPFIEEAQREATPGSRDTVEGSGWKSAHESHERLIYGFTGRLGSGAAALRLMRAACVPAERVRQQRRDLEADADPRGPRGGNLDEVIADEERRLCSDLLDTPYDEARLSHAPRTRISRRCTAPP